MREFMSENPPQVSRAKHGLTAMYLFRDKYWGESQGFMFLDDVGQQVYSTAFANYTDLTKFRGVDNYTAGSEEEKIAATIKDYYSTQIFEIISGPADQVEAGYDAMIATMRDLGAGQAQRLVHPRCWTDTRRARCQVQRRPVTVDPFTRPRGVAPCAAGARSRPFCYYSCY